MNAPLIAVADSVFPSLEPAQQVLAGLQARLQLASAATPEAILAVARQADALLVTYAKITGDIIRQLERCQIIARFGIGVDNIDLEAATQAGIVVTYVPDYCVDEVSDHALALLLALARKVTFANQQVQTGRWEMPAVVPLRRLRGRTLGLAGFGKIPQLLTPKAQAFGLKVITFDPYVSAEVIASLGVERVTFDQLLQNSDYISIHAPLTPETHHLFNAQAFQQMKPEALLINTARGPLVDVEALAVALDEGRLAGAALDVLPVEPPPADFPLRGRDNVILTPHTAFYSEEALLDLQTKAAQDVALVLSGGRPKYPLNPQVLK
jgi:D-3-phosphoglycerate dehydrogenase